MRQATERETELLVQAPAGAWFPALRAVREAGRVAIVDGNQVAALP